MKTELKRGCELKRGDVLCTGFGNQTILDMLPYSGPFDFICCVAKFPDADMSIERGALYEVLFTR
ncbi:hypothetical protein J2797_005910 [Paraburkholderia terricola]|uniref:hypothetical protein n=1 Tax=Paraburkholderia terricola TaxID=169427 RepID=UPI00285912A9|nr:hypothetical protein [Paraburkholderia terricola]MDR6495985.1 hypothetical protein [Paraburkholderia terricola]